MPLMQLEVKFTRSRRLKDHRWYYPRRRIAALVFTSITVLMICSILLKMEVDAVKQLTEKLAEENRMLYRKCLDEMSSISGSARQEQDAINEGFERSLQQMIRALGMGANHNQG